MPLFSHYGNIPDISDQLAIPALVFCIVTPLFVAIRFASRIHFSKSLGSDDWTIAASMICAFVVNVQMIVACSWAFGKHVKQVNPAITGRTLKLYFFAQILYKINIGLTKVSILLLYHRIFVKRWFQKTVWTCIGVVVAFTIGTTFSSIFQCSPIAYAFDKTIRHGTCINMTAFWYANAAFNIFSDIVIVLLPIPVIQNLQLPGRSRFTLIAVFAVGLFVCVTSVLRIFTLNLATNRLDITWNSIGSSMWTVIESNLGVICACMPSLRRPLMSLFPRMFGKVSKTYYIQDSREYLTGSSSRSRRYGVRDKVPVNRPWLHLEEIQHDGRQGHIVHQLRDGRTSSPAIIKTTEISIERHTSSRGQYR